MKKSIVLKSEIADLTTSNHAMREASGHDTLAVQSPAALSGELVPMFERLARDPTVDVEKLKALLAMHERLVASHAKIEFDRAFAQMQGKMPIISRKGEILDKAGKVRNNYALDEDIQEAVQPILEQYGFSIRFRNEVLEDGRLKVIGILTHAAGHSERDEFVTSPDDSGSKAPIQAIGSGRAYGRRYTRIALLNIVTRGTDDDGEGTRQPAATLPAFDALSDGVKERVGRAFLTLGLSKGMQTAKLVEYLTSVNVVPEEGAQALLEWCRAEFAKREGRSRATQNAKTPTVLESI